ncbi:MAG: methylglutamate dehydrogenase, partial [Methyloversatilis sp. 12-65-5]
RFDAALELTGTQIPELLRQTCAFDFSTLAAPALVMTSMVGVGVTALTLDSADGPVVRLWCDGTWGGYLWLTLVEVAGDLGGGAVGVEA